MKFKFLYLDECLLDHEAVVMGMNRQQAIRRFKLDNPQAKIVEIVTLK